MSNLCTKCGKEKYGASLQGRCSCPLAIVTDLPSITVHNIPYKGPPPQPIVLIDMQLALDLYEHVCLLQEGSLKERLSKAIRGEG